MQAVALVPARMPTMRTITIAFNRHWQNAASHNAPHCTHFNRGQAASTRFCGV